MKVSLRGNTVLIAIPRGEIDQIGLSKDGFIIDELVMAGRMFDRIVKVSVSVDNVKSLESLNVPTDESDSTGVSFEDLDEDVEGYRDTD